MNRLLLTVICGVSAILGWYAGSRRLQPPQGAGPIALHDVDSHLHAPRSSADSPAILSEQIDEILARGTARYSISEIIPDVFKLAQNLRSDDLAAAIASARSSTQNFGGRVAQLLAGYWAEVDLDAARNWMLTLPPSEQSDYTGEISHVWARLRPAEMLGWFEALPDDDKKRLSTELLHVIAGPVSRAEPERAVKLLFSLPRGSSGFYSSSTANEDRDPVANYLRQAVRNWAEIAPQRAADYVLSLPGSAGRSAAVEGAVSAWVRRDPTAARVWAEAIPDAVLAARAMSAYAMGLAYSDPRSAADYVANLPATEANQKALDKVAEVWVNNDLDGALAWVHRVSDENARRTIFGTMLQALLRTDVAKAAEAAAGEGATLLDPGTAWTVAHDVSASSGHEAGFQFVQKLPEPFRDQANASVISAWASEAPRDVENWARALPEGTLRGSALAKLALVRVNREPTQVASWVGTLPAGPSRDAAISQALSYSWHLGWDQTAALTTLASDREVARVQFIQGLRSFTTRGDGTTRQWIEQTANLTAQEKAAALAPPGRD